VEQKPKLDLNHLSQWTIDDFLRKLASDEPIPGGGSVSALAGALGAALIEMYCKLGAQRKGARDDDQEVLQKINLEADNYQHQLVRLITDDSLAYGGVMAAFKLPKSTDEEIKVRQTAIQKAFHHAVEVPMQTLYACLECLYLIAEVSVLGNKSAFSDLKVAEYLCQTGAKGALENIEINLPSIKDHEYVKQVEAKVQKYKDSLQKATHHQIARPV
jgi:glutamate formiminotransferase/formiminotetrahydrofolate cyclodeaminase